MDDTVGREVKMENDGANGGRERAVLSLPSPGYLFAASFRCCDLVCRSTCYAGFYAAKDTRASATARKATGCIFEVGSGKIEIEGICICVGRAGEGGEETALLMLGKWSGMFNAKLRGERGERKHVRPLTQGAVS